MIVITWVNSIRYFSNTDIQTTLPLFKMEEEKMDEVFNVPADATPKSKAVIEKMKSHVIARNKKPYNWSYDDFDIGAPLGSGKFGRVYLARDRHCHLVYALKLMHKSEIVRDSVERQVLREIEIQSHLK